MRAGWAAEGGEAGWAGPLEEGDTEATLEAAALSAAEGLPLPDLETAAMGGFWKSCAAFATRRVRECCVAASSPSGRPRH